MTKPRENTEALMAEINITPFTDVLLVLLIIFMILAALTIPPGFERTLQDAGPSRHTLTFLHSVPVVIGSDRRISINGVLVSTNELYTAMARLRSNKRPVRVALYADTRAPYGLVIRVLDAAKAAGITDVSFVTE
jgi:biopolymer transport protein ExbD